MTLHVAVIGSGPAGIYTAEALVKQSAEPVEVDVVERLPTPYGLVRYGVAPDHTSIKSIANYLRKVLELPQVRFLGGVSLGSDVSVEDLLGVYDAVVYCTGAMVDRRLGIPGEDLPGSVAATDFVNWYCGHPDVDPGRFTLDTAEIAVIGVGNVAVDVVRVLAKTADELRATDVPHEVLQRLGESEVKAIHMVGRRGPEHAKFTLKELRELGELANADVCVRPDEAVVLGGDFPRQVQGNIKVLQGWADREPVGRPRRLDVRFWMRPVEILGTERVEGLKLERTRLSEEGRVVGTGEYETLPVGMVLRSVGYQSVPLPGVPFSERTMTVPNEAGRVRDREYVAGWLKRGPTGVIGTNKSDAAETVRTLLADLDGGARVGSGGVDALLAERGVRPVTYQEWLAIEAAEAELARSLSRGERVKLVGLEAMLRACRP
ncbi:FAD-dependent oxidoreductase [Nonomuraea gerenzanensis]|uniref:ferredoxin--NADP(+) reductase n=1 Tax=Nonomuraea gerenzanensis TaxID=93944 RepID=A0A1M4E385_9ACTN|nr:FAD-dependent oxidoreductase [Nonomuraea gerenzanensis]UBU15550.1 FAD-dependent oxidoreductase [Nonomuraea gerenzanensis]SBO93318.1 Ferredoxin--NADP(+) reductase, actinobacterial (eukaryote-like) type [Nonomuraea gerenzanensis]